MASSTSYEDDFDYSDDALIYGADDSVVSATMDALAATSAPPETEAPPDDDMASDEAYRAREDARTAEREGLFARLNPRQSDAVNLPDNVSVLVLAGAGSGKTAVITARVAKLVYSGTLARQVLAVTFTNKASEEMKVRLRKLMDKKRVNDLWVGTFHSLCNRILRDNYEAAGLPKSFAILDTDGQEAICRGALKDLGLTKTSVKEAAKARAAAGKGADVDLLSHADPLARIADAGGVSAEGDDNDGEPSEFVTPAQCAKYISSRKEAGESPKLTAMITTRSTTEAQMEAVFGMYELRCAKSGLLDFQDLLTRTVSLLETNELVREKYRNQFSSILVDEFQDTNDIQYRWLELIKGPDAHVMAVGDDYQSIYAFRGANPQNMFRFLAEMATDKNAPEGRMVKLEQNYRSLPHILGAANAIIANNTGQMDKTLFTAQPDRGERIDLVTYAKGNFEANSIARSIHRFIKEDRVPPSEIAVLYRTNQQSRLIEQELNKLSVPLTVYGGFRFYERQEVKTVLAYLDLVTDMTRDLSFTRVANFPPRGLGERTLEELRQTAKEQGISMMEVVGARSEMMANDPSTVGNLSAQKKQLQLEGFLNIIMDMVEVANTEPLHRLVEILVNRSGLKEHYLSEVNNSKASKTEAEERVANISELISAARQFELDNPHLLTATDQLPEYMAYVALMTSTSESDMSRKNTVSLMTVHSSKGLEFDHVFITGLDEAIFPHARAIKEDEESGCINAIDIPEDSNVKVTDGPGMQEERRLMYVAVTRARKTLTLSHAHERLVNGESINYQPSRFLLEIPENRLNRIDDSLASPGARNPTAPWKSRADYGNHEYGGDAFDEGRDPHKTLAPSRPVATVAAPSSSNHTAPRIQSSFDAKLMTTDAKIQGDGAVRVVSKRKERGSVVEAADETVIDLDRSHAILGNRHFLNNHEDAEERAQVIAAYDADYQADIKNMGPMFRATQDLAARVAGGERLALRCWCAPRNCHADLVAAKVVELARELQLKSKTSPVNPNTSPVSPDKSPVASPAMRIAIIGTAGRDKDKPMTSALWDSMLADARTRIYPEDTLVSGGAAWADHVAVALFLEGTVKKLVLHLPAPLKDGKFSGPDRNSAGSAANYYHGLFRRITGVDGLNDIEKAISRGAEVTYEPEAVGYGAMGARNKKVAGDSDALLAYTFGTENIPADGGTKDTWDRSNLAIEDKVHVCLGTLVLAPRPDRPAFTAPAIPSPSPAKSWQKPWSGGQARDIKPYTANTGVAKAPSEATRARLINIGRRPAAPRPH